MFELRAVGKGNFHEIGDGTLAVKMIQRVQNGLAINDHVLKIPVHAAAVFPGKIGVDGAQTLVAHDAFHHHFTQDPLQRRRFILVIAVAEMAVPYVKPKKMDDLMERNSQRPAFAVFVKDVKTTLFQKVFIMNLKKK